MSTLVAPDLASCLELWSLKHDDADVAAVVASVAAASVEVSRLLAGFPMSRTRSPVDRLARDVFVAALRDKPVRCLLASDVGRPRQIRVRAPYAVAVTPLDPARNQPFNAPVGTLFSVRPAPAAGQELEQAYHGSARDLRAAGFVLYGPATVLGLTLGQGTQLFVLDPASGTYRRSQAHASIPVSSSEVALNASNVRHWDGPLRRFFTDLVDGSYGPYQRDFTVRWVGSIAAETYRILRSGGLFLYPADDRPGLTQGRLYLVHQAQPIAWLVEQAGGLAVDATADLLDKPATDCHQRTPVIFGSRDAVREVRHYLTTPEHTGEHSPLFRRFGLFRR